MTMKYFYSRELIDDAYYDINNPFDVDSNGKSVTLYTRISEALPKSGLQDVILNEQSAMIVIDDLDESNKKILDETVEKHKKAAGTINYQTTLRLTSSNGENWSLFVEDDGTLKTKLAEE